MKINQVEELTGITKKNIRFYEEQGLLKPSRNPANSYREYSLEDVRLLRKIRLLRKLAIPIEDIRRMIRDERSLQSCMESHLSALKREEMNLLHMQQICRRMLETQVAFEEVDPEYYLNEMDTLEKGGTRFMDIEKIDKRKRKIAPIAMTVLTIVLMLLLMAGFWQLNQIEPAPVGLLIVIMILPILVIVGVICACRERMKEIEGGEWNEARKY